jgi:hypothetical protein
MPPPAPHWLEAGLRAQALPRAWPIPSSLAGTEIFWRPMQVRTVGAHGRLSTDGHRRAAWGCSVFTYARKPGDYGRLGDRVDGVAALGYRAGRCVLMTRSAGLDVIRRT